MTHNPKQKPQTSEIKPDQSQQEKTSSSWWKFLAVAVPAYTYFFGYSSKKYYLEGLGFGNPEISGEPGPIYEFAFNSFIFVNSESLKNSWSIYIKSLEEGWIQFLLMSLTAGIALYVFSRFLLWHSKRQKRSTENKYEEKKQKALWISIGIAVGSFIANLAIIPAIILIMTLISIMFLPAPIIGYAMATNKINEFTCTPMPTSLIEPCATVHLEEGEPKIGNVLHTDSNFLYIFTEDGAETIPLVKIKYSLQRINKIYSKNVN